MVLSSTAIVRRNIESSHQLHCDENRLRNLFDFACTKGILNYVTSRHTREWLLSSVMPVRLCQSHQLFSDVHLRAYLQYVGSLNDQFGTIYIRLFSVPPCCVQYIPSRLKVKLTGLVTRVTYCCWPGDWSWWWMKTLSFPIFVMNCRCRSWLVH